MLVSEGSATDLHAVYVVTHATVSSGLGLLDWKMSMALRQPWSMLMSLDLVTTKVRKSMVAQIWPLGGYRTRENWPCSPPTNCRLCSLSGRHSSADPIGMDQVS